MTNEAAIKTMLGLLAMVIVFHFCIITKVVPYTIAWGGQIQNDSDMYVFETISISINLFLGFILLMKGNYIKFQFSKKRINLVLWIFLVIFSLNTVGNLFAKTSFEKVFSVVTLLFAVLIWKILRKNAQEHAISSISEL